MALENEAPKSKPMLNLSRRAKQPARKKRSKTPKKSARFPSPTDLASLPIPSFGRDPEIDRLEKEFFKDFDSDDEANAEPQKPKAALASKLPAPDFVSCLDSDTDGDEEEDDLLAPPIFAKKSVPAPLSKLASFATGAQRPRSPARLCENDLPVEDGQDGDDGMAAPWSASSEKSSRGNSRDVNSSQLLQCIDRCFRDREVDLSTVTLNTMSLAVERELSITLKPEQRNIVRERVMSLVDVKVKEKHIDQPSQAVLEPAVDDVLGRFSDQGKCTIKEVMVALQSQFGVNFTEETKIVVRKRLIYTLNNPPLPAISAGVAEEKAEPNRKQEKLALLQKPATSVEPVTQQLHDQLTTAATNKRKDSSTTAAPDGDKKQWKSAVEYAKVAEPNPNDPTPAHLSKKPKGRKPESNVDLPSPTAKCVAVSPKAAAPSRNKRSRKSRPAVNTSTIPASNSDIPPAKAPRKTAPARGTKRARGSCPLCLNCPCTNDMTDCNAFDSMDTVQSEAAQEKNLIKRLQKLEKTAERYEEQTDAVRRKLKKHRRDMWRKHEALAQVDNSTSWPEESRFLPDMKELDSRLDGRATKARVSAAAVRNVQSKMFSFAPTFQPTLTQMFGGGKKDTDSTEDTNLQTVEGANLETIEEEPDGEQVVDLDVEVVLNAEETSILASDEEDDVGSEGVEVDVHRVEWKDGVENSGQASPIVSGPSIWRSLMTGDLECTWDRLFAEDLDDESVGIDHLLGMLDDPKNVETASKSPTVQAANSVEMEMLSQRGQLLAEEILGQIDSDEEKVEMLEATCPNWKENIIFALFQQESEDVHEALERVKRSKEKLLRVKQEILKKVQQQEAVLNVFADALRTSLSRAQGSIDEDGNEGFFPTQAPESPLGNVFDGKGTPFASPTHIPRLRRSSHDCRRSSHDCTVATNGEDDFADFTPEDDMSQDPPGRAACREEQETHPSSPSFSPSTPLKCGRESVANTPHSAAPGDTIIASIAS
jgi:hypothetical protein